MKQPLLPLLPNRVRRNYCGGAFLDRWESIPEPKDGTRPEDWLASTTPAINRGMPDVPGEGLGHVCDDTGREHELVHLFQEHGEYYLGHKHIEQHGPSLGYLAKLLDSSMRLHTQAHPTREFAQAKLGSPFGKLECYVILAVRPEVEGKIRLGFQRAPTHDEWREIVERQDLVRMDACFDPVPVAPGQVWWVPGGMVHALGKGLLLLEVMEPSDLVVRCEFERKGIIVPPEARWMGRDLEFCLDVFEYTQRTTEEVTALCRLEPVILSQSSAHVEMLGIPFDKTRCFEVRRLRVQSKYIWTDRAYGRLVVAAEGYGTIQADGQPHRLQPGGRFFAAAESGPLEIVPDEGETLELCVCQACGS